MSGRTIKGLAYVLLAVLWITGLPTSCLDSFALPDMQSSCVEQAVGNAEIVAIRTADLDQDGNLDAIVIYVDDIEDGGLVHVLVALNQSSSQCKIVIDDHPLFLLGGQGVNVREMEMVELTGDDSPELHIWLETSGGGSRQNVAYHAIYTLVSGNWQHALGDIGITQCLVFSSFEFRDAPSGHAKDVYLDEDRLCNPPWSSHRNYSILRWNGSKFVSIESGTIDISTTDPPWVNVCCAAPLVGPAVVLTLVVIRLGRRRPR